MLRIARIVAPAIARLWERGDALMDLLRAETEQLASEREARYLAIMRDAHDRD